MASFTERLKARLAAQNLIARAGGKTLVQRFAIPSIGELQARSLKAQEDDRPLNFIASPEDAAVIFRIVERAIEIGKVQKPPVFIDHRLAAMDLTVVHLNDCPLKLIDFMLTGDTMDFVTDFGGIGMHINRRTGGFMHGWWPTKFAKHPKGWAP